jgi:hypothetical protein
MFLEASLGALGRGLLIAAFTAVVGSLLAWLIGMRVSYGWDERKRRRESDLAARAAFYENYGEFFATWKLWDAAKVHARTALPPNTVCWDLLERASKAEAGFEALLVKIASERMLSMRDKLLLASFREGYQMLRETIRKNETLDWKASGSKEGARQYRAFKALAEYIAFLLEHGTSPRRRVTGWTARRPLAWVPRQRARGLAPTAYAGPSLVEQAQNDAITNLLSVTSVQFRRTWWEVAEATLMVDRAIGQLSAEVDRESSNGDPTADTETMQAARPPSTASTPGAIVNDS